MTARESRGPIVGLAAHLILVTALAVTAGVSAAGWLAATAYAVVLAVVLGAGLRRSGMRALGPANAVTLGRATLVGGVTALVVTSFTAPVPLPVLVTLVGVALALDGVDGQVARRTGSTTKLGARFDMEIDAFLVLVLSVYVAGTFGWWTIAMGAFRYVFVAASWVWPWLSAALPPRFSRKVVAAVQGVALVVATASLLPDVVASVVLAAALATLTWSFGRDVQWLRHEESRRRLVVARARVARRHEDRRQEGRRPVVLLPDPRRSPAPVNA
ncbi:membrane protein [Amorphoplanes auranticolor]|uniref:Membrane protein n=2 Tax=Actinoplanes auranticolor TaxID=47988 RepID=A0A919W2J3_9ACTN|nr:membrane protein [Actinoplanes auranticolor]